jgi:predicted nucleic acid-binding protein
MPKVILTDACFWLGLIDPTDQHHEKSNVIAELLDDCTILLPWPCLYESISTRLVRNRERTLYLESILNKPNVIMIDDSSYRPVALMEVFDNTRHKGYSHNLADGVIREVLKDRTIRIQYLVTFNSRDFADVCLKRQIEIIEG